MSRLSPAQIAAYVRGAGVREELVPTMTAIALAESSGNPTAHNPNARTGDNSYGLFQVNMIDGLGPERRRKFGLSANEELFDPAVNATAAKRILDSQGLNAWSVHKSGAYKRFMDQAQQGASVAGASGSALGGAFGSGAMTPAALLQQGDPGRAMTPEQRAASAMLDASFAEAAGLVLPQTRMAGGDMQAVSQAAFGMPPDQVDAVLQPLPRSTEGADAALGGQMVDMVALGKKLEGSGLRVREHSAFGGVGKHSPGSLHYSDRAFDLTDWKDPGESQKSWLPRKKFLEQRFAGILGGSGQILGPVSDPGGHGTHIHLGIPSGRISLEKAQALVRARMESLQKYPLRWAG